MTEVHSAMQQQLYLCFILLICIFDLSRGTLRLEPDRDEVAFNENEKYFVMCADSDRRSITWSKGRKGLIGGQFKPGQPHVTRMGTHLALIFDNITSSNRGDYFCRSEEDEIVFKLTVILPITFVDTSAVQTVMEGHPGLVKCKVKGDPKPTIVWKFNGADLPSSKYESVNEGLRIKNVSLEDRGNYTCTGFQFPVGIRDDKNILLNIKHKPIRKQVHAKVDILYGYLDGKVNLTCEAIAEPQAKFTWTKNKTKIHKEQVIEQQHWSIYELNIHTMDDFGDYHCKAENELGILEQILNVQEGVKPPPPQKVLLKSANANSLVVEVVGAENKTELPVKMLNMLPIGYRIYYLVKDKGFDKLNETMQDEIWSSTKYLDFDNKDDNTFVIPELVHNKQYFLRAATRNLAGLSDFTPSVSYKTLRTHAELSTSSSCALYYSLLTLLSSVLVAFIQ